MVKFASPLANYEAHRNDIDLAIREVLESGIYVHGPVHGAFERSFAVYIGVDDSIGVASGTDALLLALVGFGIGRGDRVIVPSHTASATISAIRQAQAIPVFADVDERSYVMTPDIVATALTPNIKAIVAVHLYGQPADSVALREIADEKGIVLIEDCAQATGARIGNRLVGSIGHAGCFSFYQTKNLSAIGDGGMITLNDDEVASRIRRLRMYGWTEERLSLESGFNSRLDELQAAILAVKLRSLDAENAKRRSIAARYLDELSDLKIDLPREVTGTSHVYHLFVIGTDSRSALLAHLNRSEITALIHYPLPTHLHPAYQDYAGSVLEGTERLRQRIVSLPIYPEMSASDVGRVISTVRAHFVSGT